MIFWKYYDKIELTLGLTALTATVLAVLIAAIGRSLGMPVTSAPQFAQLFLIWTVMFGADLTMKLGMHIRVSALTDIAPVRVQKALAVVNSGLILVFLGFVAIVGWDLSMGNWQRELGASGLSYGLVTLAMSVGAGLLIISVVRRLVSKGFVGAFQPAADAVGGVI